MSEAAETIESLASSGAKLLEDDERTMDVMEGCLSRLRTAHATPSNDCAAIMAELQRKQEKRRETWWGRLFG